MKIIEFAPEVLKVLEAGPKSQGELTEELWGSSGKNSPRLVNLLNYLVSRNLINRITKGRTKWYSLPK